MTAKTYYEKLKDPRWQKKRLEVMSDRNFTCELCGDTETSLNVHHKEYFKGLDPWEYDVNQLACLCENCHENHHDDLDILKFVCSYANLDGANNRTLLAFLLAGFTEIHYEGLLSVSCLDGVAAYKAAHTAGIKAKNAYQKDLIKQFNSKVKKDGAH